MSYLDPRAGQASGDETNAPESHGYRVPDDAGDPYADFRYAEPAYPPRAWHANEPVTAPPASGLPEPAAFEPVDPEPVRRGPGRRRARAADRPKGRAGRNLPAAIGVGVGL